MLCMICYWAGAKKIIISSEGIYLLFCFKDSKSSSKVMHDRGYLLHRSQQISVHTEGREVRIMDKNRGSTASGIEDQGKP